MKCPFCESNKMVKAGKGVGKDFAVAQRYLCKSCGRTTTKPDRD